MLRDAIVRIDGLLHAAGHHSKLKGRHGRTEPIGFVRSAKNALLSMHLFLCMHPVDDGDGQIALECLSPPEVEASRILDGLEPHM